MFPFFFLFGVFDELDAQGGPWKGKCEERVESHIENHQLYVKPILTAGYDRKFRRIENL